MRSWKFSLVLLMIFVFCASGLGAARGAALAATTCPNGGCKIYLPAIAYMPQIALISPADGEQTISLAPILKWTAPVTGTFHIQVSEDSAFAPTSAFPVSTTKALKLPIPAEVDTVISTNLKSKTIYYWRIQVTTATGEVLTTLNHFTTPPEVKALLPAGVPLIAPATNSKLPTATALLQWQTAPNTLFYRVRVFDPQENLVDSAEVEGTLNSLTVSDLAPGTTYHWRVKALNIFGWGDFTPDFLFTTP